jgi:hypothetical protein
MRTLPLVLAALAALAGTTRGQEPPTGGAIPAASVRALSATATAAASGGQVGDYGDRECIEFRGLKSFTAEVIRDAVFGDTRILLAAHPAAPKDEYLGM